MGLLGSALGRERGQPGDQGHACQAAQRHQVDRRKEAPGIDETEYRDGCHRHQPQEQEPAGCIRAARRDPLPDAPVRVGVLDDEDCLLYTSRCV